MNPRNPKFRRYSDEDVAFLMGDISDVLTLSGGGSAWKRTLTDAGVHEELSRVGVSVADFPDDAVAVRVQPDATKVGPIDVGLDIAALLVSQFKDVHASDERFEKTSDRWKKAPDRVQGYVPADAGSLRWTMLTRRLLAPLTYDGVPEEEVSTRIAQAEGGAWAYMAAPHFIPADVALDVVTASPPPPQAYRELRLPHRYVMVFHDGVPLSVVGGDEDIIDAFGENALVTGENLLLGGILSANDDGTLYDRQAYLIVARRDPDSGWYGWEPVRVTYGSHPAGRVLFNYAALLSWEGWKAPPKLPTGPRGKAGSANQMKKAARSVQAQDGGWHGVHVLDYRPPDETERPVREPGSGRERRYQAPRRAYFTSRTRIGVRDEQDRLVGPVYGEQAEEGKTFVRARRFVRRTVTRADLPERPEGLTAYRVPRGVRREDAAGH